MKPGPLSGPTPQAMPTPIDARPKPPSRACSPDCWSMPGESGPCHHTPSRRADATAVGSEEAPIEGLASVRRSNGTCSFPAFRFHEWLREIRREGINETRLTSLNSPKSRLVGYSFQPVFRHRLARCDHSLRTIHPSSWWKRFLTWERQ